MGFHRTGTAPWVVVMVVVARRWGQGLAMMLGVKECQGRRGPICRAAGCGQVDQRGYGGWLQLGRVTQRQPWGGPRSPLMPIPPPHQRRHGGRQLRYLPLQRTHAVVTPSPAHVCVCACDPSSPQHGAQRRSCGRVQRLLLPAMNSGRLGFSLSLRLCLGRSSSCISLLGVASGVPRLLLRLHCAASRGLQLRLRGWGRNGFLKGSGLRRMN